MSFALRSAAIARLILDASLLHCTRERPTLLNFADQSFCWMRPLLSADPSLLTWLCTSPSAGFASVWWSFLAIFFVFFQKHVSFAIDVDARLTRSLIKSSFLYPLQKHCRRSTYESHGHCIMRMVASEKLFPSSVLAGRVCTAPHDRLAG